jgi:hypothetical protein
MRLHLKMGSSSFDTLGWPTLILRSGPPFYDLAGCYSRSALQIFQGGLD